MTRSLFSQVSVDAWMHAVLCAAMRSEQIIVTRVAMSATLAPAITDLHAGIKLHSTRMLCIREFAWNSDYSIKDGKYTSE